MVVFVKTKWISSIDLQLVLKINRDFDKKRGSHLINEKEERA